MKTLRAVALVVFQVLVTVVCVAGYLRDPARAQSATAIQWLLLYVVAVGHPIWWTVEHYRLFRRHAIPMDQKAYALAWSPVWVGSGTLLIALALFL